MPYMSVPAVNAFVEGSAAVRAAGNAVMLELPGIE